jgi:hypothetical protein
MKRLIIKGTRPVGGLRADRLPASPISLLGADPAAESGVDSLDACGTMAGMSDYSTVDRVIADLKRLSAGFWHTDREREIGNVMVDARHCLVQLMATVEQLQSEAADAKKWAMSERSLRWQAVAHNSDGIAQGESCSKQGTCGESRP